MVGAFVLMQMELSPQPAAVSARLEALVLMQQVIASTPTTKVHGMVPAALSIFYLARSKGTPMATNGLILKKQNSLDPNLKRPKAARV